MTLSPTDILLAEFNAIEQYLSAAQDVIHDGHMPDITPLEGRISDVCKTLQTLQKPEQQLFLAHLSRLLNRLDDCELHLREWQKTTATEQQKG